MLICLQCVPSVLWNLQSSAKSILCKDGILAPVENWTTAKGEAMPPVSLGTCEVKKPSIIVMKDQLHPTQGHMASWAARPLTSSEDFGLFPDNAEN